MEVVLVDRFAISVAVDHFHGMGAVDSRSLRYDIHATFRSSIYLCSFSMVLGDVW
jgi:hypothetical protein